MGKNNNIIEINGKRYDSQTGTVLSHAQKKPAPPEPIIKKLAVSDVKIPDYKMPRRPAKHAPAHRPARATTLMRHAVQKPISDSKRQIRAYGPADALAERSLSSVVVNKSARSLDKERLQKAVRVAKSQLITHFSEITASDSAQLPTRPSIGPAQSTPAQPKAALTCSTDIQAKSTTTADLLERALQNATAHQQPPHTPPRHNRAKHHVAVGAMMASPFIILAVIAAHNLTGIRLQVASATIGFSAKLPDYQPPGFSQGTLNYSPGVVAAQFHSNSDDRAYTITQKRSPWDSLSLRDSFVAPIDAYYKTTEESGKTIYLYSQHSATWVHDGIWYIIQTNGSLSDRQLVELATSL